MLVDAATNVIFEPFLWLVLNRSGKACLTLSCIIVVVCSTAFLCKSVNVNFCIKFSFIKISKFYQNFKNHLLSKFNKTYLVNVCFALPSTTVFWNYRFYFCFNVHKLDDMLYIHLKKDSMSYFLV